MKPVACDNLLVIKAALAYYIYITLSLYKRIKFLVAEVCGRGLDVDKFWEYTIRHRHKKTISALVES